MRILIAITSILFLSGCTHFLLPQNEQLADENLERQLQNAEDLLAKQEVLEAEKDFAHFLNVHAISVYSSRAHVGHARALIDQGDFNGGLIELQTVLQNSLGKTSRFVAEAAFYSSSAYEGLGDELKALASLKDAETWSAELPPEIAKAELPARLAVAYNHQQDFETAKTYFAKAQQGVEFLYRVDGSAADIRLRTDRARTYAMMGQFAAASSADAVSARTQVDSLEFLQFFSLRAMEENDPLWSKSASEDLQKSYQNVWNHVNQDRENMRENLGHLVAAMEKLRALRLPENTTSSHYPKEFFTFLTKLETEAQVLLVEAQPQNPLTPESKKRDGLRRAGVVYSEPRFKNEKHRSIPMPEKKQLSTDDPNIEGK